ncbi:MAG: cytochrome C oxidase subunit IV family protein [Saprospiraceae bacterium]|nr:cytochrome C oxidase subunit IV family protein [Candidatus Vicinibacter affinis]MBP6172282.1 cytochrome C oxidase subunit IV family protein [Saprospiraceae bacterium]MBK6572021.1 cytochrome C oxidase subunit IV family protein [Candidatus Vicinibacter affinis]MBK6823979.1 cytochrome C oxidase subunit IV family protein [Candidatus Vicinibacter affinis]MBK7305193.1 cytochrome C oxidase subunit IV family protein [Candidatus Vicinibacter affinis]
MGHLSYEEGKKVVFKGLILLGVITLIEVFIALIGKGYVIHGFHLPVWLMYILMIGFSLYKAYFIVYEFMHMRYEVPGLVRSVLLPTMLLIWAMIAFFSEGTTWLHWRAKTNDRPISSFESSIQHGKGDLPKEAGNDESHMSMPAETHSDTMKHDTTSHTLPETH